MSTATKPPADARARIGGALGPVIPEHLARLDWDEERLAAHQAERLCALVEHARERSPFHAERLAAVAVEGLDDLGRLPTMTKRDLMDRFDDGRSSTPSAFPSWTSSPPPRGWSATASLARPC